MYVNLLGLCRVGLLCRGIYLSSGTNLFTFPVHRSHFVFLFVKINLSERRPVLDWEVDDFHYLRDKGIGVQGMSNLPSDKHAFCNPLAGSVEDFHKRKI